MLKSKNKVTPLLQFGHADVVISAIKTKYDGFFKLNEYHLSHKLFSQQQSNEFTREVFERGDAVVVMLYDQKLDKLLLLEQFRAGALRTGQTPWTLEFIAGMFNDNENPIEVAVREAKEEANISLTPTVVKPIMNYLSSSGGTSENIHLYWAAFDSTKVLPGSIYGLADDPNFPIHIFIFRAGFVELFSKCTILPRLL